jgi:hypothetical protein
MHSTVSSPAPGTAQSTSVPRTNTKVADSTQLELCVTVLYGVGRDLVTGQSFIQGELPKSDINVSA